MAFSFAVQPQDYMLRAQAGLPVDPTLSDGQVSAQAAQALAAPLPAANDAAPQSGAAPQPAGAPGQMSLPNIPVSPVEAFLSWLAHGGSPAEAAQNARAVKLKNMQDAYALMQSQMVAQRLQNATPQQRDAILFNAPKYGESVSSNFALHDTPEGATSSFFGGPTQPGGYATIAPKLLMGSAGQPGALTQNGYVSLGPQLAGKKTSANGIVTDENLGVVGNYAQPETVAGRLYPFQPGVSPGAAAPPTSNGIVQAGQPLSPNGPGVPATAPGVALPAGRFDALNFIKSFVIPHEGGLNPRDMNGAPSKYGINQTANPGVDVAHLTPDQATSIYMNKYLPASGAANLSPALGAVHLDTSIINPARAQQFLQQSGGDPAKYLQLRQAWMQQMLQTNPAAAPYAQAWAQRNADLGKLIAGQGGAQDAGQPAQDGGIPGHIGAPVGPQIGILPPDDPAYKNFPAATVLKRTPDGDITAMPGTGYGPEQLIAIRGQLQNEEPIKNWRIANTAYGAMVNSAAQPNGGMRAYALRDTFARLINPGAVARVGTIQALKESQGIPANIQSYFMNLKGDGDVPPQIAQQILDVGRGFLASHYAQAKATNDNYSQFAQRHKINPDDVAVPLGDEPPQMHLGTVPPAQQRQVGAIYATPKGPLIWKGNGWAKSSY